MTYDHWKTTNPDDEFLGPALAGIATALMNFPLESVTTKRPLRDGNAGNVARLIGIP